MTSRFQPGHPGGIITKQCRDAFKANSPKRRGPNSPYWKGFSKTQGYKTIAVQGEDGLWKHRLEHVVIAEKVLGRRLGKNEVVHHIDGDRKNNRNDNLLLCSIGYHRQLHEKMALLYQIEHFRRKPDAA